MSDYPEHDKLRAIHEQSQAIGEFLDWLRSPVDEGGKGVHLHTRETWTEPDLCPNLPVGLVAAVADLAVSAPYEQTR
jgi:hypothetical protein